MRFLTPEAAMERLTSDKNVNRAMYLDRKPERETEGKIDIGTKVMIHAGSLAGMKIGDMSDLFGISTPSVSAIKNGLYHGTKGYIPDIELQKETKKVDESITERATNLVLAALQQVEESKLLERKDNKLRDVTGAAKDLASIVEKVSPKSGNGNLAAVVFVTTNPYDESRYTAIEAVAKVG